MKQWVQSPSGRVILWVLSVAVVSIGLNGLAEALRWEFWKGEAQAEIDAHDVETLASVKAGQSHAQVVARMKAEARPSGLTAPVFPLPTRDTMQPTRSRSDGLRQVPSDDGDRLERDARGVLRR